MIVDKRFQNSVLLMLRGLIGKRLISYKCDPFRFSNMVYKKIGFQIVGSLVRRMDREPSHLYQCFFDEAENEYILHRGILTIVAADGRVY